MWNIAALVLLVAGFASCSITCHDGKICSHLSTCCRTKTGYACCPVPNAVCCNDLAHCCPSGYRCNAETQMCERGSLPWSSMPMLEKVAAQEPSSPPSPPLGSESNSTLGAAGDSSAVHCDNQYMCPDGTTCCRHPKGLWFCCPYSPGKCCLDGYHCCPYGYDCDPTYTKCVRYGLSYPFTAKKVPSIIPAAQISQPEKKIAEQVPWTGLVQTVDSAPQSGVIRCDGKFYCPAGTQCCKGTTGRWGCCPYPLGTCCSDGLHCCEYGYNCDPTSMTCKKSYSQIPSGVKEDAKDY